MPSNLLFCSCKARCATKTCPCKKNRMSCTPACHPLSTCCNICSSPTTPETIYLSGEMSPARKEDCWKVIGTTMLNDNDKACIQSHLWLNDKVIFAAEQLLKQQHSHVHGLQDTILQCTATLEVMASKQFIQILNHGNNHWITISTMGCTLGTVNVYDSMNLPLTKDLETTVADLLHVQDQYIILKYIKMQYQVGTNDCGLFAIASACAICSGENPAELKFNQAHMRTYLLMAFENAIMTPFPSKQLRRHFPVAIKEKKLSVYCSCRRPYNGEQMMECFSCKKWFHCSCMRISDTNISKLVWLCENCRHSDTAAV